MMRRICLVLVATIACSSALRFVAPAGVPGSVTGMWEAHRHFASLPWAELVRPAVNLAEGIVVHESLAQSLQAHEARNDAWRVATAESINADVVGADRAAFERLGARYLRFR